MKIIDLSQKLLFKSLIVVVLFLAYGCEEEAADDMVDDTENNDGEGGGNEAPSELSIVINFAGTYDVVDDTTDIHNRETIIIGEDGRVDFDTDISFEASAVQAVYDRIECCSRIQLSYGADDDGEVINLFLNEAGDALSSVQFRHRNESIDIEVSVTAQ